MIKFVSQISDVLADMHGGQSKKGLPANATFIDA